MAILAMSFDLMQDEIISKVTYIGEKTGIVKRDDDPDFLTKEEEEELKKEEKIEKAKMEEEEKELEERRKLKNQKGFMMNSNQFNNNNKKVSRSVVSPDVGLTPVGQKSPDNLRDKLAINSPNSHLNNARLNKNNNPFIVNNSPTHNESSRNSPAPAYETINSFSTPSITPQKKGNLKKNKNDNTNSKMAAFRSEYLKKVVKNQNDDED
jgi:hypothetical protein